MGARRPARRRSGRAAGSARSPRRPRSRALRLARVTYEFVRPVPLGPLAVARRGRAPGRRVTLLDGFLTDPDGIEVARARALLLVASEVDAGTRDAAPLSRAARQVAPATGRAERPTFATHAMEIRFVEGAFGEPGPATAWFRLRHPLIAGEPTAPLELVAAAGDFGNGIASELSWAEHVFINPDLTLYLEREPVGEWVALQSRMRVTRGCVATAESVLWDERGRIGRAIQALLVGAGAGADYFSRKALMRTSYCWASRA